MKDESGRAQPESTRAQLPQGVVRCSPVVVGAVPEVAEVRDGWKVALRYGDGESLEGGPWLVDLSHRRRWDCQDADIGARTPMDLPVPRQFGQAGVHGPLVISRMNRTQAAIWHLGDRPAPSTPPDPGFTETTDGHCMLAFVGPGTPEVLEHLTPLDLFDPARPTPFLTQGPVLRVPCQIVTFAPDLVVMTLARGYGETFAGSALASGGPARLRIAGEGVFSRRFAPLGCSNSGHAPARRRVQPP